MEVCRVVDGTVVRGSRVQWMGADPPSLLGVECGSITSRAD